MCLLQVYIDSNGDAEGNFSVVALLNDKEATSTLGLSMQPVGYFRYDENNTALPVNSSLLLLLLLLFSCSSLVET
ncbi:hypothetical protein O3M35_010924 [Rhynocoris fuscipes]|uniref:Uncharacterized protein n=1 Tax=Rhynocoris fuscipes TaxID=488301 RepID=A0AAW1D251_9HEMI